MQSGGSLDGCHYRTDATCKTVANKGISFVYAVLGPYTPPQSYKQSLSTRLSLYLQDPRLTPPDHSSHKPPTIYSESLGTVQLFVPYLGCTLFSQFSASTTFLCA